MSVNTFTQFTLSGQQCATNNVFVIDKCSNFCGSTSYGEINFDSKANDYVFTVYTDDACTVPSTAQNPLNFGCDNGKIGEYTVTCGNPVPTYDQFKISGQKGSECSTTDIIDLKLNTCGKACGVELKIIENAENNNGYTLNLYEDDQCTTETDSLDFTCKTNNGDVAVGGYLNVVCVTESDSSSTVNSSGASVVYSLVLIASAALLSVFI